MGHPACFSSEQCVPHSAHTANLCRQSGHSYLQAAPPPATAPAPASPMSLASVSGSPSAVPSPPREDFAVSTCWRRISRQLPARQSCMEAVAACPVFCRCALQLKAGLPSHFPKPSPHSGQTYLHPHEAGWGSLNLLVVGGDAGWRFLFGAMATGVGLDDEEKRVPTRGRTGVSGLPEICAISCALQQHSQTVMKNVSLVSESMVLRHPLDMTVQDFQPRCHVHLVSANWLYRFSV